MNDNEKIAVEAVSCIFETLEKAPYLAKSYGKKPEASLSDLISYRCNPNAPHFPEYIELSSKTLEEVIRLRNHRKEQLAAFYAILPENIAEQNLGREQVHSHIEKIINNPEGLSGIALNLTLNMRNAANLIKGINSAGYNGFKYKGKKQEIQVKIAKENPEAVALLEQAVLFYAKT
jgi:hypothetical protein